MIDAQDPGTSQLPLTLKRGRGRPRKADALTAAERARRYRANRLVVPMDCLAAADDVRQQAQARVVELEAENARLAADRRAALRDISQLHAEVAALAARRDVTKNDEATSRQLLSVASRLRAFARDPGAIVKPRSLHDWARVIERCAGVQADD